MKYDDKLHFAVDPAGAEAVRGLRKLIEDRQRENAQMRGARLNLLCDALIELLGTDAAEWRLVEESCWRGNTHTTEWRFERRES